MRVALRRVAFALAVCGALPDLALAAETSVPLTASQVRDVKRLPPPIALVGRLAPGLRVARFAVDDPKRSGKSWGYRLEASAPDGRKVTITEETSGDFGDPGPDPGSIRRPFTVTSPVLGETTFDPSDLGGGRWCYLAYVAVPHANVPPIGSKPVVEVSACQMERDAVEQMYRSFVLAKAQTPYPKR